MAKTPTSQTPVTTPGPSAGETLDRFDRDILALLQQDASLSAAEIGVRVGLSQSPCWRRINRLEEAGLITRRVALLDRHRLGLDVLVFAMIKLNAHGRRSLPEFADAIRRYPEVQECFTLLGDMDFLVRNVVDKQVKAPLHSEPLTHIHPVVVARTGHPLAGRKKLTLSQLLTYDWIDVFPSSAACDELFT